MNPTSLAGINANLAYGCFPNHSTSQSDVVRAYIQSTLNTKVPTWVELPAELVPEEFKGVKRPCVRLYKSLYGHPEAGWHLGPEIQAGDVRVRSDALCRHISVHLLHEGFGIAFDVVCR